MLRLALSFFLLLTMNAQATPVIIRGETNAPNQRVRLIVIEDFISNLEKTIASSKTDMQGNFILNVDIQYITTAQLVLALDRVEIVLKPGSTYSYKLTQSRPSLTTSYFEKEALGLQVLSGNDGGLQKNIDVINMVFNAFVIQHFDDLYRNRRTDLLDTLRDVIAARLTNDQPVFVSEYNTYKQAALLQTVRSRNAEQWIQKFIIDKPVLYANPEYMNLLNEVFRDYLISNRHYQQDEIIKNIGSGFSDFILYVSSNPLLTKNIQIAELVGLINLRDLYYNSTFKKNEIIQLLRQFKTESQIPQHNQIAVNIIESVNYLAYNTNAPAFSLKNTLGKEISLNDFNEKKIVLSFVQDSCQACIQMLMSMKPLFEKYKEDYDFITISTAAGFNNYVNLFKQNGLEYRLLNMEDDILLLEDYRVKTFPEFFILLKQGKIGMAPAPQPDQNLEFHLQRLKDR
ncbi:MAG: redoxin domain-containing protein [Bacteroidales bacterium]|nr:redoxin domain-containing protein [Bacteroidales bacterium]